MDQAVPQLDRRFGGEGAREHSSPEPRPEKHCQQACAHADRRRQRHSEQDRLVHGHGQTTDEQDDGDHGQRHESAPVERGAARAQTVVGTQKNFLLDK